jgi:heme exporter protein A
MNNYELRVESLEKKFGRRLIFRGISFEIKERGIFGIAGSNGSGKSTLVKTIAGLIAPSEGRVIHSLNGKGIEAEKLHNHIGFVSPYLVLYDEFTASENLDHVLKIRGVKGNKERIEYLLKEFKLFHRKDDMVKTYSSGMKQRLKFIFSLVHEPELLIYDEPTSNLDEEGKGAVYKIVEEEGEKNVVIIASNEATDLALCNEKIILENFKN